MTDAGPVARAAELAALGHRPRSTARRRDVLLAALDADDDPRVRAAALGALVRARADRRVRARGCARSSTPAPAVRRRAAELAPALPADARVAPALVDVLDRRRRDRGGSRGVVAR